MWKSIKSWVRNYSKAAIQWFDFQLESGTPLATWGPRTQWWPPSQPHPSQPWWPPASSKTTNTTSWSRSSGKFTGKCSRMWSRVVLRPGRLNRYYVGNLSWHFVFGKSFHMGHRLLWCELWERREQGKQLSFWWKTFNLIGHYRSNLCKAKQTLGKSRKLSIQVLQKWIWSLLIGGNLR